MTSRLAKVRPTGWKLLVALPLTFAAVGALGTVFPLILGNGRRSRRPVSTSRSPRCSSSPSPR